MARQYIRPEIDKAMLKDILGRRKVLVDPTLEEVQAALAAVQKRSTKNLVSADDAGKLWADVVTGPAAGAWAGRWHCPAAFQYGMDGTVLQIIRLGREHIGCVIERQKLTPGQRSAPPIEYDDREQRRRNADRWHQQAMAVFWPFLTDAEIEAMRQVVA